MYFMAVLKLASYGLNADWQRSIWNLKRLARARPGWFMKSVAGLAGLELV
jgi:hypothetical protein